MQMNLCHLNRLKVQSAILQIVQIQQIAAP